MCEPESGQCQCGLNYGSRDCGACAHGFYSFPQCRGQLFNNATFLPSGTVIYFFTYSSREIKLNLKRHRLKDNVIVLLLSKFIDLICMK